MISSASEHPAPTGEVKEYKYKVGDLECTAMLTEAMAARVGGVPVGEAEAEAAPVEEKSRRTRNKQA